MCYWSVADDKHEIVPHGRHRTCDRVRSHEQQHFSSRTGACRRVFMVAPQQSAGGRAQAARNLREVRILVRAPHSHAELLGACGGCRTHYPLWGASSPRCWHHAATFWMSCM